MLSIFAQRVASRVPASSISFISRSQLVPTSLASRAWSRSFIATPYTAFPVKAKAKSGTKATPKKTTTRKTAAKKKPIGIKSVTAKKAAGRPKVVHAAKKKKPAGLKLSEDMLPPKKPGSAYLLFHTDFFKNQASPPPEGAKGLTYYNGLATEAGRAWKQMTDEQKQPFEDRYGQLRKEYEIEREKYFKNVSPEVLKAVQRRLKKAGRPRIPKSVTGEPKMPLISFMRFHMEQQNRVNPRDAGISLQDFARQNGEKWRNMSDAEKAPYTQAFRKEMAEFRAKKAAKS